MKKTKLTIEITPLQQQILSETIPWGEKQPFFAELVLYICSLLENASSTERRAIVSGVISKRAKLVIEGRNDGSTK